MPAANQSQVRLAIDRSGISGTAAEVLQTITSKTISRIDSDRKHYSDVSTLLTRAGLPGDAIVDGIRADLLTNGPAWICDQLGGIGIDFSHDQLQFKLDEMQTAGRITSQLASILKEIGCWSESPLEYHNNIRGLTTDEATVQAVLDEIQAEQQPVTYDRKSAVFSLVIQPDGKACLSCQVSEATADGRNGQQLSMIGTADADNYVLPGQLVTALTAVRNYVESM